jgi:hypothetical protein
MLTYKGFVIQSEPELMLFLQGVKNVKFANQMLLDHPEWLDNVQLEEGKVTSIFKYLAYGEASVLILRKVVAQFKDRPAILTDILKTEIRKHADRDPDLFTEAFNLCFDQFDPSSVDLYGFKEWRKAIPTAKAWGQFLRAYLEKTTSIAEISNLPSMNVTWGSDQTYLSTHEVREVLKINDEVIPKFVGQQYMKLTQQQGGTATDMYTFTRLAAHLGSAEAVIKLYEIILTNGLYHDGVSYPELSSLSLNYSEAATDEITEAAIRFYILKHDQFNFSRVRFSQRAISNMIQRIFHSDHLAKIGLAKDYELQEEIYRYYTLLGIKNTFVARSSAGKNVVTDGFNAFFLRANVSDSETKERLEPIATQLQDRYKDYPEAGLVQAGNLLIKISAFIKSPISKAQLDVQLESDLTASSQRLHKMFASRSGLQMFPKASKEINGGEQCRTALTGSN